MSTAAVNATTMRSPSRGSRRRKNRGIARTANGSVAQYHQSAISLGGVRTAPGRNRLASPGASGHHAAAAARSSTGTRSSRAGARADVPQLARPLVAG
ncbi:MAG: hypothetical protein QOC92_2159 [Acidimicrobiaceae bacterium]|jgi:hypothetical protein